MVIMPQDDFEPELVRISGGVFTMGSTEYDLGTYTTQIDRSMGLAKCEQPKHDVRLSDFYISKYPITNSEYRSFLLENGEIIYPGMVPYTMDNYPNFVYPEMLANHPVVGISWHFAKAYCKWVSEKSGKQYRLPTEAEWEQAARGPDNNKYPWGFDFVNENANTIHSHIDSTSPVGQFSPQGDSFYKCCDMAGNVWEWCEDWFNENEYQAHREWKLQFGRVIDNPIGPTELKKNPKLALQYKVLRGGSYRSFQWDVRCATRLFLEPHRTGPEIGFRVVQQIARV